MDLTRKTLSFEDLIFIRHRSDVQFGLVLTCECVCEMSFPALVGEEEIIKLHSDNIGMNIKNSSVDVSRQK